MKIELINENQIKCTLNRSDLAFHQIRLSELAYGTEKTRDLFQDMMDRAFTEFGFEAGDALMIEAIPVSMDCIVLMITKVDEPDEMDQGFSELATVDELMDSDDDDDLGDLLNFLAEESPRGDGITDLSSTRSNTSPHEMAFSFADLDAVITFAHKTGRLFKGESSLYKSPDNERFYLQLVNTTRSVQGFGHICNLALEYGSKEPTGSARSAYMDEHYDLIIPSKALQKLASV